MIYLHCLRWLEDPTRERGDLKLKKTKQVIEIFVRGRRYDWNQAWKNMKSAGAIGQLPQPGGIVYSSTVPPLPYRSPGVEPLSPLPPDIEIRTLSAGSLPDFSTPVECATQPSSGSINIPAHGLVSRDRTHTRQKISSCSSDNTRSLIQVPSNHRSDISNEWMRDMIERIWIDWTILLPIGKLVSMTIGMYPNIVSPHSRLA